jgi:hypothetical protein
VEGWLSEHGARALVACLSAQERHNVVGSLAEIGVYHGRTFIGLTFAARPNERILGVDIFEFEGRSFRATFDRNIEGYVPASRRAQIVIEHRDSRDLYQSWRDALGQPARFVHLDGNHVRGYVQFDFSLAASYLAPGGLIVCDDLFSEHFPDATTGIIDSLRAHPHIRPIAIIPRLVPLREASAKLICGLRGGLAVYEESLLSAFPDLWHVRRNFVGEGILIFFAPPATARVSPSSPTGA